MLVIAAVLAAIILVIFAPSAFKQYRKSICVENAERAELPSGRARVRFIKLF